MSPALKALTEERLAEVEARAKAAPPRPIHMTELSEDLHEVWYEADGTDIRVSVAKFFGEAAGTFFCEAIKDVPDLLAEVRRLRREGGLTSEGIAFMEQEIRELREKQRVAQDLLLERSRQADELLNQVARLSGEAATLLNEVRARKKERDDALAKAAEFRAALVDIEANAEKRSGWWARTLATATLMRTPYELVDLQQARRAVVEAAKNYTTCSEADEDAALDGIALAVVALEELEDRTA